MLNFDQILNPKPFIPINLNVWTGTGTSSGTSPRPTK